MKPKTKIAVSFKKGSLLLTESPFVYVLKSKLRAERCDFCFQRSDLKKCTGCSYVFYCDRECQKKGWFFHKNECSNIKRVSPRIVPDAARMLARIIFKLEKGGSHERSFYTKTNFRVFKDLMSHYNDIKEDKERMEHLVSLHAVLTDYLGNHLVPNTAELLAIYGRMVVNTFNILDGEMQSIGTGMYLGASVVDHSCTPNAVAVFEGTTIFIRTLEDLQVLDWNKVLISYIDLVNLPKVRQKELQSTYYFLCQCQRCLDVEELGLMTSITCQNTECNACVPQGSLVESAECPCCNFKVSADTWEEVMEITDFTDQQLGSMHDVAYLDVCRMCLKKQDSLFHAMNLNRVKVLDLAMESSIELGSWDDALAYGEQLLEPLLKYYGQLHPLRGIFLMKMGKIALLKNRFEDAKKWVTEAARILLVTHSEQHSLFREEVRPLVQQLQCVSSYD